MKISRNKKGSSVMWNVLIAFIICLAIAGVYLGMTGKWRTLNNAALNLTHFGIAGGDTPNIFLFMPKTLSIDNYENNPCTPSTDATVDKDRKFNCKPGSVSFVTEIFNGGKEQRRFYGGIVVCQLACKKNIFGTEKCTLADKTCKDRIENSQSDTCTVKNADSAQCSAGSHTFKSGQYLVFPAATCFLSETYGCSQVGMTQAPFRTNSDAYLYLTVS